MPCKAGREGDEHPEYFGNSVQYNRCFKQLRRFQALSRLPDIPSSNSVGHRAEIWRAIRHAPGFSGFSWWWGKTFPQSEFASGLPVCVPSKTSLHIMYQQFRGEVKSFEKKLRHTLFHDAKQRRTKDVSMIFRDCPKEQPSQVDTLVDSRVGVIKEVCVEDSSLILEDPISLMPDAPVIADGQPLQIIYHEADQIWVEEINNLTTGDQIRQEKVWASDAEILREFQRVWGDRWQKLHHMQSTQWDQVVGFLRQVVQPMVWNFSEWSRPRILKMVKSKKKKCATGPDGVSRKDVLSLPPNGIDALVCMYNSIEQTGVWPQQLSVGIVKSLDKQKGATSVDGFRPITIYPLLYRVWSSCRAKEALLSLSRVVPSSVRGGLLKRQSKSIWFEVAQIIEMAHFDKSAISGIVLDIRRAFNALPRLPLWEMLHLLNFPDFLIKTWASFTACQVRRFRVRQSTGIPLDSCTGLPEGCAMSVFGMCLVDWSLDLWLREMYRLPSELFSYVDDWQVLFREAHDLPQLLQIVGRFSEMFDLEIDFQKSHVWATEGGARAVLKQGQLTLVNSARDLGAHQNFTRHAGNKVLQQRFQDIAKLWPVLRKSLCPYRSKILGIQQLARFATLRTGALRALRADRVGAHPALHLLTVTPFVDPECWAVRQTLQDARTLGNIDQCRGLWLHKHHSPACIPGNGPASVLAQRLAKLGWVLTSQGTWIDEIGEFCPLTAHWLSVQLRIQLAWPKVVASMVAHRVSFAGIQRSDWFLTSSMLKKYGEADQVFIKCALDGTMYTDTYKEKSQRGSQSACVYCGEIDGFFHRLWQCNHFQSAREGFRWTEWLDSLPSSLTCHGWAMQPPSWCKLLSLFDAISAPKFRHLPFLQSSHTIDLFTDGTCQYPEDYKLRYAGWAVTLASPFHSSLEHVVVGAGQVQGLHQSSYRAEVVAVKVALQFVHAHGCKARIWCDCQSVVDKFQQLLRGGSVRSTDMHSDVWTDIATLLHSSLMGSVEIGKVASHCDIEQAGSEAEAWAFWHNKLVDSAAATANQSRSQQFWETWESVRREQAFSQRLLQDVWEVILKASRLDTKRVEKFDLNQCEYFQTDPAEEDGSVGEQIMEEPEGNQQEDFNRIVLDRFSSQFVRRCHFSNLNPMLQWWSTVGQPALNSERPAIWMSGLQLYVDYVFFTELEGPTMVRGKWVDRANATLQPLPLEPMTRRVKSFLTFWKAMLKELKIVVPAKMQRAHSAATTFWGQCYRLKWPLKRCNLIDTELMKVKGRQLVQPNELGHYSFLPVPKGNGLQETS